MFALLSSTILLALQLATVSDAIELTVGGGSSHVSSAWYPGWRSQEFKPSDVNWSKYTHVTYGFA